MSETAAPGASIEVFADYGVAGLTGTLGVSLLNDSGGTAVARATTGITALGTATPYNGLYKKTLSVPVVLGEYVLRWDSGGTAPIYAFEDLLVAPAADGSGTATVDVRSIATGGGVALAPSPRTFVTLDDVDPTGVTNGQIPVYTDGVITFTNSGAGGTGSTPEGPAGGSLTGSYPDPTLGVGVVSATQLAAQSVTTTKIADLAVGTNQLSDGAVTNSKLGAASVSAANLFGTAAERALMLGKGGTIPTSVTDGADFLVPVPMDMQLRRMKVTFATAPTSASAVVQLRRSTNSGSTWANVASFSATVTAGARVGIVDPGDVNVNEGDLLNFSVSTGSGANMTVVVIGVAR